ncbi:transposase [Desulfoferula mesophila]|uniref:Transposase n=1 Tax=Desulfoferula mesophila TaxID=3058419 RepID=A0AAU9ELU6_9BACT|nr:transposase [Desulfoferula mesophilus]
MKPVRKRALAGYLEKVFKVSERRACQVLKFARSSHRYQSIADRQDELRMRLRDLAAVRVSYGYRRLHVLLRREGWLVNAKRVYRLYTEEGLTMRRKRPRRRVSATRRVVSQPKPKRSNESWSMDFVSDQLYSGHQLRVLTIVDNFSRESLALKAGQSLRGDDVVAVLNQLVAERGAPKSIKVDNGSEFTSKVLDQWAYWNKVELDFSRPGKPTDNPFIESFNGRLREECLNENWFVSVVDAQDKLDTWRLDYNQHRPHSSLGNMTPEAYAKQVGPAPCVASPMAPSPKKQTWESLISPGPETGSTSDDGNLSSHLDPKRVAPHSAKS